MLKKATNNTASALEAAFRDKENTSYNIEADPLLGEYRIIVNFDPDPQNMDLGELQFLKNHLPGYLDNLVAAGQDLEEDERFAWEERKNGVEEMLRLVNEIIDQWDNVPQDALDAWENEEGQPPLSETLRSRIKTGTIKKLSWQEQRAAVDFLHWYYDYLIRMGPEDDRSVSYQKWEHQKSLTHLQMGMLLDEISNDMTDEAMSELWNGFPDDMDGLSSFMLVEHPNQPHYFITSICTVLLLIPNCLAARRTVALFSTINSPSLVALSSMT